MKTIKIIGKLLLNSLQLLILVIIIPDTTSYTCYSCYYEDGWDAKYGCVTNQSIPGSNSSTILCPPKTTGCYSVVVVTVETNTIYDMERGCGSAGVAGCQLSNSGTIETCIYNCNDGDLCNDDSYETDPINVTDTTSHTCYICNYFDGWEAESNGCVTNQSIPGSDRPTIRCPPKTIGCYSQVYVTLETNTIFYITRGCGSAGVAGCRGSTIQTCTYNCNDGDLCNYDSFERDPINVTQVTEAPGTISCYSCVYSYYNAETDDTSCVHAPENVTRGNPYVRCPPTRSCSTTKLWDKSDPSNPYIRGFLRGCDPPQENKCFEDIYFITYKNYCGTELCNSGDPTCPPARPPSSSSLMLSNFIPIAVCLIAQIGLALLLVVK